MQACRKVTNYRHQRRYVREVGAYPAGTFAIEVYEAWRGIVNASSVSQRDDIVFGVIFFMRNQYLLEKGLTEILRLHFVDALGLARQVIEGAAFADRVHRHPHLAMIWLRAVKDDGRYAVYRKKFAAGKLFPEDDPLMRTLGSWFDWASKHIHGSTFSFGPRFTTNSVSDGNAQFLFNYVDVRDRASGPADLMRMYLAYLTMHLATFDVFARVFADASRSRQAEWNEVYQRYDAALLEQKRRLAPALAGRSAPNEGWGKGSST
jgi:hypothetical protein